MTDMPTTDRSMLDGSTLDGSTTDAAAPGDAAVGVDGAQPSCDELYGAALDYMLCVERLDECEFYARTNGSCDELCQQLGGHCLMAYEDDTGATCDIRGLATCDTLLNEQICVCTRPPSCGALYGYLPGYTLCSQSPSTCEFFTGGAASSCQQMCSAAGATCISAYNNLWPNLCGHAEQVSCSNGSLSTFLCQCSR